MWWFLLPPPASKGLSRDGSVQTALLLSIPSQPEVVKENETDKGSADKELPPCGLASPMH